MRVQTKLALSTALTVGLFLTCQAQRKLILTNPSDLKLSDKAVSIKRSIIDKVGNAKGFPLLRYQKAPIASQLNDLDGDGKWDELFLLTDFLAKEKKTLALEWVSEAPRFEVRTSVRFGKRDAKEAAVKPAVEEVMPADKVYAALGYQAYQTDGPSWENDKVGFRHYLDGRNSKDVFGKKTAGMTPENVGISAEGAVEDNYHQMHNWGRDIFPVGSSVGLGGYALLINKEVHRLGILGTDPLNNVEKTTFKIQNEGAVNSVLKYDYQNWKAAGNQYQVQETTSIWPGMYAYKNTLSIAGLKGSESLLIALSNINNQKGLKVIEVADWVCLIQHDKLTYNREWILGTAILVPKKSYAGYMEAPKKGQLTDSYLAKINIADKQEISYYAVAAWELSADKGFSEADFFSNYVTGLAKELSVSIGVTIK